MSDERIELNSEELRQKINLETGSIEWSELVKHFAKGMVVVIGTDLDLIKVAECFAADDQAQVAQWIEEEKISRAQDDDARRWNEHNTEFWSVVVAPWVLVQEKSKDLN